MKKSAPKKPPMKTVPMAKKLAMVEGSAADKKADMKMAKGMKFPAKGKK